MPIPSPKKNENQQEFVSRCMGDKNMQEYDQKQRAGICYTQFRRAKNKHKATGEAVNWDDYKDERYLLE